jgi:hypothetical protein
METLEEKHARAIRLCQSRHWYATANALDEDGPDPNLDYDKLFTELKSFEVSE